MSTSTVALPPELLAYTVNTVCGSETVGRPPITPEVLLNTMPLGSSGLMDQV